MKLIKSIIRPSKVDDVQAALNGVGVAGITITEVRAYGKPEGHTAIYRGHEYLIDLLPKMELEVVVADDKTDEVVQKIIAAAHTGEIGDGRVFVERLDQSYRIRTGELETD
jgi:nitrogen regulatory protein PII